MAELTLTNIDESILLKLRQLAETHQRSLEAEACAILTEKVTHFKYETLADYVAAKSAIREYTQNYAQSDSTALIREDRDR